MRTTTTMALALLLTLGAGGCESEGIEESATMRPSEDCLACHNPGGSAREAWFGAAGTVVAADGSPAVGVAVTVTDTAARVASDVTNSAGNFYFEQELTPPLQVSISAAGVERTMADATGACNSCHGVDGAAGPIVFP